MYNKSGPLSCFNEENFAGSRTIFFFFYCKDGVKTLERSGVPAVRQLMTVTVYRESMRVRCRDSLEPTKKPAIPLCARTASFTFSS